MMDGIFQRAQCDFFVQYVKKVRRTCFSDSFSFGMVFVLFAQPRRGSLDDLSLDCSFFFFYDTRVCRYIFREGVEPCLVLGLRAQEP